MLIDWFTVFAQLVNFLVLAWLLKRFLYQPILQAIDAREEKIAAQLADVEDKKTKAERQQAAFQKKNADFDEQKATKLRQLDAELEQERSRRQACIREEAEALKNKLQLALKHEQESLQDALTESATEEVFSIARKTLTDLADASLDSRMTAIFIQRLGELDADQRAGFLSAFKTSEQPMTVRTAFALPEDQHLAIEAAIEEILGKKMVFVFAVQPNLVSGIEIDSDGQKVAWSIAEYLSSLAARVSEVLQSQPSNRSIADVSAAGQTAQDDDEISH